MRSAFVLFASLCVAAVACSARPDVDRLLVGLDDPHWQVRASAAEALGGAGAARSIPRLRSALADDSGPVRAATLMSLARLGARDALDDIRARIRDDEDAQVVVQALYALSTLGSKLDSEKHGDAELLVSKLTEETERVDGAARRVLFSLFSRDELVAQIRADLHSGTAALRARGSRMALALRLPELSGWERELLEDPDDDVRRNAYESLAWRPETRDEKALLAGLLDPNPGVRALAASGLAETADRSTVPALERVAGSDAEAQVRLEAAWARAAILGVPGSALPALWHYERLDDRLQLDADGTCALTRTMTLMVDRAPEAVSGLKLLLPRDFPRVDRVVDDRGRPLAFAHAWKDGLRELVVDVPPIQPGEAATFTLSARSVRPLSALGTSDVLVRYGPGPAQAPVRALHVAIVPPGGGRETTLDRVDIEPGDLASLVVDARVPIAAMRLPSAPPRAYSLRGDLTTTAGVVAAILACLAFIVVRCRRTLGERADRVILVCALTTGAVLLLSPMLLEDNFTYFALARSAVFDHDLDRANEYVQFNQSQVFAPDDRGALDPVFGPVFDMPFVAAAHAITLCKNALSPHDAPNGFSFPYLLVMAVGDFLAVLIGCLACFSLVERRIGRPYALFAVLAVVFGTNLLLYAYAWTGGSFQPSFLLFAVFLNHWDRTRDHRRGVDWLGGGALLGLLGITRTLNLGFALIPLLDWLREAPGRFKESGAKGLARHTGSGALLAFGMALAMFPQLLAQRLIDHAWYVDAYGIGSGRFTGLLRHLWGLFLAKDGLLSAMPLFASVFVGLVVLVRMDRRLGLTLTAALALQLIAIGSYEIYWGYFRYGTPYLVPASPIFCLAIASLAKSLRSRWHALSPALLWIAAASCAARNGWCLTRQIADKMIGNWEAEMGIGQVLHTLLLLDRKQDGDVLRASSEFACLLREIVGGVRALAFSQLLASLFWVALLVAAVVLVVRWGARARSRAGVVVFASAWLALVVGLTALAARTDLDYGYTIEREWDRTRELVIHRLGPGESYSWRTTSANPSDRFGIVTFLDDAVEAGQGEVVATVALLGDEGGSEFTLRAGVDTADFAVDRPESRGRRGHRAPLDRACFSYRVRDDSSRFYTARAYATSFVLPAPSVTTTLTVTSALHRGALAVVLASATERKIPRDPARRRWIAERW